MGRDHLRPVREEPDEVDTLLHLFPRLERDDVLLSHINLPTRARVPCLAGRPPFELENSKIAQLNTSFLRDRLQYRVQNCLHSNLYQLSGP